MKSISLSRDAVYSGTLILVNRDCPLCEGFCEKRLVSINEINKKILLGMMAATTLQKLMDDMDCGEQIVPVSCFRSKHEQEQIYEASLRDNGADFTAKYVALPGHSEHQTGLAIDLALNQPDLDVLRPYFPYTGICGAFRDKAVHYGFIERYPKGKETITGIAHEPWHFRFVGAPHAMIMNRTGDTLEEYHTRLKQFSYGQKPLAYDAGDSVVEVCYLAADKETITFEIENDSVYTVSGNNTDGFILTIWRENR